eukprot:scaffold12213_cov115-Isochrysis_galbana.AAC.6
MGMRPLLPSECAWPSTTRTVWSWGPGLRRRRPGDELVPQFDQIPQLRLERARQCGDTRDGLLLRLS